MGTALCKVGVFNRMFSNKEINEPLRSQCCSCISLSELLAFLLCLSDRDARGMTPFMLAVSGRAYPAAITVLEAAQKIAKSKSAAV